VNLYDREVKFDEFRQRVRRHTPTTLLPLIASRAREKLPRASWYEAPKVETPWGLAAAARASLLYGSEHRQPATRDDVEPICAAFASLKMLRPQAPIEELRAFFLRTSYQQLTYQSEVGYDVARSVAMFRDSLTAVAPTTLTPDVLAQVLGGTVVEFVGTGWLLFASAMTNDGIFLDEWIDRPQFRDVIADLPAPTLRALIERSFAADIAAQRSDGLAHATDCRADVQREAFAYNPLQSRPLVTLAAGRYVIPSPLLLLRRITTTGIYYAAMAALGPSIGTDLGAVFEHYVGRQLAQVPGARLIPEITYGREHKRTVDWFLILDDMLVLVEVKAPRLTEAARMGDDVELTSDLDRTIGKARGQIDRTAALLAEPPDELIAAGVPTDRPVRGLIVTLEPYYLVHSPLIAPLLPASATLTTTASVHDVEHMVRIARGGVAFADQLRRVQDDAELATWSPLAGVLKGWPEAAGDNPILDQAGDELPWRDQMAARKAG
jgi:hypothetical protein